MQTMYFYHNSTISFHLTGNGANKSVNQDIKRNSIEWKVQTVQESSDAVIQVSKSCEIPVTRTDDRTHKASRPRLKTGRVSWLENCQNQLFVIYAPVEQPAKTLLNSLVSITDISKWIISLLWFLIKQVFL